MEEKAAKETKRQKTRVLHGHRRQGRRVFQGDSKQHQIQPRQVKNKGVKKIVIINKIALQFKKKNKN